MEPTLTESDAGTIEAFLANVAVLEVHSLVTSKQLKMELSFGWSPEHGTTVKCHTVGLEALESILMRMRPFMLQRSRTFAPRVIGIATKLTSSEDDIRILRESKSTFVNGHPDGFRFPVDKEQLTDIQILDIYLNGEAFHKDHGKQEQLTRIRSSIFGAEWAHAMIMSGLTTRANIVISVGDFLKGRYARPLL